MRVPATDRPKMDPRWVVKPAPGREARALAGETGLSTLTAACLIHRGVDTADAARRFLRPGLQDLHDPGTLPGVPEAAARIRSALRAGEKILVCGDYDADGITGTAILVNFLRLLGADTEYFIPRRAVEGYGLSGDALNAAADRGVRLVISVDCGITAFKEARIARERGMDLVITDHHEPARELPEAFALINAKLPGSPYPFREISGSGTAFKLAWGAAQAYSNAPRVTGPFREFLLEAMALAGLGTIADVVPLTGENRTFAAFGLRALARSGRPGITALRRAARIDGKTLDAKQVAFRMAPRLNALGRLGDATAAVELFTTDSADRADAIAADLETSNRRRQEIEREILASARERLDDAPIPWGIVLEDAAWHEGVIGIVASKLAEEIHRPAVLIAVKGDTARGSGRSIPGVPLHRVLESCGDVLTRFGGHAQAAGFEIRTRDIPVFRERFAAAVRDSLGGAPPQPEILADAEVSLDAITPEVAAELARLAPFGNGNPEPLFVARAVTIADGPRPMGAEGRHLEWRLRQGTAFFRAVGFGWGPRYEALAAVRGPVSIVFQPSLNEWQGRTQLELILQDLRATDDVP
ncbi:MAG: single-stranded-DNA-specific exonuclease RecJ [Planctomycetota bacterium]